MPYRKYACLDVERGPIQLELSALRAAPLGQAVARVAHVSEASDDGGEDTSRVTAVVSTPVLPRVVHVDFVVISLLNS